MNKIKILKLLYNKPGITREEIRKILNITFMGVSKIINILIREEIVKEKISEIKGKGRPSKNIYLNLDKINVLGIHLSFEKIVFVLGNFSEKIKLKNEIYLEKSYLSEDLEKILEKNIEKILKEYNLNLISIAMNGIVNSKEGKSIFSSNYQWKNVNLRKKIEEKYKIKTLINNGSNLLAYYFQKTLKEKKSKNIIAINLNQGIGAGVIIKNEIYEGSFFQVGEIGHVPYNLYKNTLICTCGKKGCLETILAKWRIEEKVYNEIGKKLRFKEIISLANEGQEYYKNIFREVAQALAYTIIWIDNLLDPEIIFINGEINNLKTFFKRELFRILRENNFNKEKQIEIKIEKYEEEGIIKGALLYGENYLFNNLNKNTLYK